jgi:hypothetical protein
MPTKAATRVPIVRRIQATIDLLLLGVVVPRYSHKWGCLPCDKRFDDFDALSLHCASVHCAAALPEQAPLDLQGGCLRYLIGTGQVNCPYEVAASAYQSIALTPPDEEEDEEPHKLVPARFSPTEGICCRICKRSFESPDAARSHCWVEHHQGFFDLFVANPQKVIDDRIVGELGLWCINRLRAATPHAQNLVCVSCGARSNSPGALFKHLWSRHLRMLFVGTEEHERWDVVFGRLPRRFKELVRAMVEEVPEDELKAAGVIDEAGNRCLQCHVLFTDVAEKVAHFLEKHLVMMNEIVPVPGKAGRGPAEQAKEVGE